MNGRMSEKHIAMSPLATSKSEGSFGQCSAVNASGAAIRKWSLVGGVLLFALLLWKTRLDHVAELLWKARGAFMVIFIPYGLVVVCETLGWRFAFPAGRSVAFSKLLRLTVAAKAIQFLTPSILQAGEFMKVHLLRGYGVTVDMAVASVVVAKTTIMIAELLFITLGLCVALGYVAVEPDLVVSVTVGLLLMALGLMVALCFQRSGLLAPLVFASRFVPCLTVLIERYQCFLSSTEQIVRAQLDEKRRFASSCLWFFFGWAAGIVEVWVFLNILALPTDVPAMLFVQVWSLVATRLTAFVPGNLGAQEAATVMTFSFLGFSPESAIAFAVLRRVRQLGWIAASFGCLTKASREEGLAHVSSVQ